ncbi:hypothetical protein HDV00_006243 [Rhizophlyctis rosea]|nr:hypothetical protein HDV00_006243 [Rhizophlyctis rosea]
MLNEGHPWSWKSPIEELDLSLAEASQHGDTEMASLFLRNGANVNVDNGAPIRYAVSRGDVPMIELLLDAQPELDLPSTTPTRDTPLALAVRSGNIEIVKLLLKAGAQVDAESLPEVYPITIAVQLGKIEMVKVLLHSGSDVPSLEEVAKGDIAMVNLLLDFGADNEGCWAIIAAGRAHDWPLVKALLKAPVNVAQRDQLLNTAAAQNSPEFVTLLIDAGATLACNGGKALAVAASKGNGDIVQALLQTHRPELLNACFGPVKEALGEWQLADSLFISMVDGMADAIKQGRYDIVEMLLEAGGKRFDPLRRIAVQQTA